MFLKIRRHNVVSARYKRHNRNRPYRRYAILADTQETECYLVTAHSENIVALPPCENAGTKTQPTNQNEMNIPQRKQNDLDIFVVDYT